MCCSSPLNPQLLFYDGHDIHFNDRALYILRRHKTQSFIFKAGYSVHYQAKKIGPNMKLNNLYGNTRINCMRHHGTLNFTPPHTNSVLVETREDFKLSSTKITYKAFKNTHTPPPPSPHQKLAQTTKLVLLVLRSQSGRNWMRLGV